MTTTPHHLEPPRLTVFDSHGQPADVHVHDAGTTRDGRHALTIDGRLYIVEAVR